MAKKNFLGAFRLHSTFRAALFLSKTHCRHNGFFRLLCSMRITSFIYTIGFQKPPLVLSIATLF